MLYPKRMHVRYHKDFIIYLFLFKYITHNDILLIKQCEYGARDVRKYILIETILYEYEKLTVRNRTQI